MVQTTPSMPRICDRQHLRACRPASNPSEYFRRTITVPILDHLLSELDKRFSSHKKNCFSRSIFGTISVGNRRSCNCVQCDDENGRLYAVDLPNVSSLSGKIFAEKRLAPIFKSGSNQ